MALELVGYWKLEKNENWDEYMAAAGVNILLRKAALNITSYEEISVEEDNQEQWHIKHTSTFRSRESHPVVGQEFEETTMDGRRVKSVLTIEGNKLVYRQKAMTEGEIDTTVTREVLSDGRLLTTFVAEGKDVTARRYFVRYQPV
ncbi:fatty acid-binding protein homolog 6-like [Pomacea canaliculata]|uniref:fatty acid-binding protein homolog 6-like n=1 Tax=Pomacea canaliculata TaxID=400727 RepID=UPI000D728263|nr:fatty acid-binding protein homolog 6-like [Pomacea canaliculata]XP_025089405.1 fatty acid-binding protein homolog 6-like [Pomacea canaliculata]XP_025089406.1 fatty acid-binding protein homolog 6-like [Pomacea canaliculata]XP_025089407.1 fatty acid-binding protein homolog 6-like [Pomacea canaliculata]